MPGDIQGCQVLNDLLSVILGQHYAEEHLANGKLWASVLLCQENKITVAQGSPRG